jgi:hypothetical protein
MNDQTPARASHSADAQRALRSLALAAVIVGVLVLAAAAFVLSYPGVHAIALDAGVSPALARLYPLIFDAMLVVASAAVLSLRGAGLLTRCYAWFSMLLLLCAAAGADALHATATRLPHRAAAATVAIIPWALVLLGFGLLLAMLRHARLRLAQAAQARSDSAATGTDGLPRGAAGPALMPESAPASAAAAESASATTSWPGASVRSGLDGTARHADSQSAELALDAEPGNDDPTSDEARAGSHEAALWVPRARTEDQPAADTRHAADSPLPDMAPAPTVDVDPGWDAAARPDPGAGPGTAPEPAAAPEPLTAGVPAPLPAPVAPFDRMWSSPTPPDADDS